MNKSVSKTILVCVRQFQHSVLAKTQPSSYSSQRKRGTQSGHRRRRTNRKPRQLWEQNEKKNKLKCARAYFCEKCVSRLLYFVFLFVHIIIIILVIRCATCSLVKLCYDRQHTFICCMLYINWFSTLGIWRGGGSLCQVQYLL